MKLVWGWLLILLVTPWSALAGSDMKAVTGMTVKIPVFDTSPNPGLVPGLQLGTTVNVLVRCGTQPTVLLDSAALFVDDGTGLYTITISAEDVINANAANEETCDWSVVGIGSMAGLLDPSHILRKTIGHTMYELVAATIPGETLNLTGGRAAINLDDISGTLDAAEIGVDAITEAKVADGALRATSEIAVTKCDISAATSMTSFTIATCTSPAGEAITLADGSFAGRMMEAYTNGGAPCNVVSERVFVQTVVAGVVTVRTSTVTGGQGGFTLTPNTTNCGVYF